MKKVDSDKFDLIINNAIEQDRDDFDHFSDEEIIDQFDNFYYAVVEVLNKYGTYSEGGLEDADFTSSKYVDPSRRIIVVSSIAITTDLCCELQTVLSKLPGLHVVVFDGIEGQTAVFKSGEIIREVKTNDCN